MNQYPIWIGLVVALVMTWAAPDPTWWMIAALGIGANGVVVAANGWRMPVRAKIDTTIRHCAMTASTRRKWLGDIIPTGFGKASIGDFLICAGILGGYATRNQFDAAKIVALLCLAWWASGWVKGFGLFEKWPAEARRDCRKNIPIVVVLMIVGNLLNVRGCGSRDLRADVKAVEAAVAPKLVAHVAAKPQPKWRSLGNLVAPPPEVLTRLRQETTKKQKREEAAVLKAIDEAVKAAQAKIVTTNQGFSLTMPSPTPKGARKGPFCRLTCAAHHGGEYDVETLPQACAANWIPPDAQQVPGWYAISEKQEQTVAWPGPANAGFESYKLYLSDLQSAAKVIHQSGTQTTASTKSVAQ